MDLAGSQKIGRKVERAVPERARTQHASAGLFRDLPVEPAQRLLEARIGERPFQKQDAILAASEMADELTQVQLQLDDDTALDVALEQQRQTQPRQRQRDQDRRGTGRPAAAAGASRASRRGWAGNDVAEAAASLDQLDAELLAQRPIRTSTAFASRSWSCRRDAPSVRWAGPRGRRDASDS